MRPLIYFILLLLFIVNIPYPANAETGTITAETSTTLYPVTYFGGSTPASAIDFTKFRFYTTNYNTVTRYRYTLSDATPFPDEANSTTFTITSGGTGNGYVYYDKASKNITWTFSQTTRITSSTFTVSYAQNIFDAWADTFWSRDDAISATIPMCIANTNGQCTQLASPADSREILDIAVASSINYTVTYDEFSNFQVFIDKSPSVKTSKTIIHSATTTYFTESTFNQVNLTYLAPQLDGIYINHTLSSGGYLDVLINATGISDTGHTGTIQFNKSAYALGEQMNISYSINSANFTAYDYYIELYSNAGTLPGSYKINNASWYLLPAHSKTTITTFTAYLKAQPIGELTRTTIAQANTSYGTGAGGITGNFTTIPYKTQFNRTETIQFRYNITTSGRIYLEEFSGVNYQIDIGAGTNQDVYFYIPENAPMGSYIAKLQYYDGATWNTLSWILFQVSNAGNLIEFSNPTKTYLTGEEITFYAFGTESGMVRLLDSNGKIKLNSSINANALTGYDYYISSYDVSGGWTANLYNSTGVIVASDNATVYTTGPTPVPTIPGNATPVATTDYVGNVAARRNQENNFLNLFYSNITGLFSMAIMATMIYFLKKMKW